jgi:hypothetical protein
MTDPDLSLASAVRSLGRDLQLRISANAIQIGMLVDRVGRIERCLVNVDKLTARIDKTLRHFEQDRQDDQWWRGADGCGGDDCGGGPDVGGPTE